jgi:ATP-binding cassette, subfamily B, multidrug efflux pump
LKALSATNFYLFKYKWHLLGGVVFVTIANIFAIGPAQIVRSTFNLVKDAIEIYFLFEGTKHQAAVYQMFSSVVVIYAVLILLMALLRGVFMFLMRQTIIVMSRLVEFDQKNQVYAHYQTLPLSFFRKNNTGDLMARISEDVSKVRMYFGPAIMYGINLVAMTMLCIPVMFAINAKLTLWALLPLPVLSMVIYFVNNRIEKKSLAIQKSLSDLSTFVQEAFSGIRVIKAFAREQDSLDNFTIQSNLYKQKQMDLARVNSFFTPTVMALVGMSVLIVVYVGGLEVIAGNITPGNIAEFIMYITMLTWPFTSLGWVSSIVQRAEASQQRLNEFLNTQTDIVSEKNIKRTIQGTVSFENVSFQYADGKNEVLKNISFELKAGQSLAILGGTGVGKSTIAHLLFRMMDVTQGEIKIDGINIKDYNLGYFRNQMGCVPQDVFLFSDTIKNNIAFGKDKVNEEEVIWAAKEADLYENVQVFPDKFETRIGERGITLSGGQKQRVSIARALIRKPQILIFDDCLSAVDTHTENTILNNLQRLLQNCTSIIISHRVSSAKLADFIVFLEAGKLVEFGSHKELMQQNGFYKSLYDKQLENKEAELTS